MFGSNSIRKHSIFSFLQSSLSTVCSYFWTYLYFVTRPWLFTWLGIMIALHYNDVMMAVMASQITSLTIVYSTVYSGAENIKARRHWPLCGEFTGDRWIPRTNGKLHGKCFHLMTSSWFINIYYNCEKYPPSPVKPRCLVLIEQYLPNILAPCIWCSDRLCDSCALSDINQHFIPSLLPVISKCWPIVTSSTHEPTAGNCDVTMTDCSRGVSMDAWLSQWLWGQWFKEFAKYVYMSFEFHHA